MNDWPTIVCVHDAISFFASSVALTRLCHIGR
jgi:hypothetical protein